MLLTLAANPGTGVVLDETEWAYKCSEKVGCLMQRLFMWQRDIMGVAHCIMEYTASWSTLLLGALF